MPENPPIRPLITRRGVLAAGAGVGLFAPGAALAQAPRDASAEQFVQEKAQRIISILADRSLSVPRKQQIFRQAVDELADVPKITNFVLGKYARSITPDQRARFAAAFRTYAENVYQNRIGDYRGETLKVTGSVVRKPGDVIVNSVVSGGQIERPLPASWRVLSTGGAWKVVDVQVKGVWLAITQQQDFVSTVDNAGGNIEALITQLQRAAQRPAPRT